MITNLLHEDAELKRVTQKPKDQKPQFEWSSLATNGEDILPKPIKVNVGGADRDFDEREIADTVGCAIADLLLARQREKEIFNEQNRNLVQQIARSVTQELHQRSSELGEEAPAVSAADIYQVIEKVLVKHNAHDVARTLAEKQKHLNERQTSGTPSPLLVPTKVIRRNGQLVPWNHNKIEIAVRKAFLSLELDSSPAVQIAEAVSGAAAKDAKQFMHIEDVQNMVEEELMKQGFYKVARSYIQYRALRNNLRDGEEDEAQKAAVLESEQQQALVMVKTTNGDSYLWDGQDLKKRIDFAALGLELCLPRNEIEMELRRSIFNEITEEALKTTIILNARTLMQEDADFAKFAARMLLTYIYEEVLGWDIVRDGIEQLPAFHRRAFRRNLARGVEIDRIHPRLLEFDLDKLADALDPAADMDFDFLASRLSMIGT